MGNPKKANAERSDSNVGQSSDSPSVDAAAVWKSPHELTPWAKNPKPIEPKDIREMKRSIRRFGFGAPIVARAENLEIIEGHLRHAAALAMRLERVPVRVLDLSSDEAHVLAIAAWKFEHRREADEKEVADILEDLEDRGVDVEDGTGFSDEEIETILAKPTAADDVITAQAGLGPEQNFGPATENEQGRLDVKMRAVVCPKCRHEFVA